MGPELWSYSGELWPYVTEMNYRHQRIAADFHRTRRPPGERSARGWLRRRHPGPGGARRHGTSTAVRYADC